MRHVVSYDLRWDKDYTRLEKQLKVLGGVRMLESVWFVDTEKGWNPFLKELEKHVDEDDGLIVATLKGTGTWAQVRALETKQSMLKKKSARRPGASITL